MDLLLYSLILSVIFVAAGNGIVKTTAAFLDERAAKAEKVEISQRYR